MTIYQAFFSAVIVVFGVIFLGFLFNFRENGDGDDWGDFGDG